MKTASLHPRTSTPFCAVLALVILVWGAPEPIYAQQGADRVNFALTARVNTSNPEIREVVDLWENYLQSRPDSIYANPYWSEQERMKYEDFDLTRRWVYMSATTLHRFAPAILSVEPEGDSYVIRTLFSAWEEHIETVNPLAFVRVYASRENGRWQLHSALPVLTAEWGRARIGPMTFIYPVDHQFDQEAAVRSLSFCERLIEQYRLPALESVEYYVTHNKDELARIVGLDYYPSPPAGRVYLENNQVFSGNGSEWYPHELVHLVFREYRQAHWMLSEGLAVYLGGSLGETFDELVKQLAQDLSDRPELTLEEVLAHPLRWIDAFYTGGAVICRMAYETGGEEAVKQLLTYGEFTDDFYRAVEEVLGIPRDKLSQVWRAQIMEYAGRPVRYSNVVTPGETH